MFPWQVHPGQIGTEQTSTEQKSMRRRQFLHQAVLGATASGMLARAEASPAQGDLLRHLADLLHGSTMTRTPLAPAGFSIELGQGMLSVLSDGQLQLPASFLRSGSADPATLDALLARYELDGDTYQPDCNITLWQSDEHTVLFDVGGGTGFMDTLGLLPGALEEAGIDPGEVTDVVFTHAHPDHLWGLLDDFDDLLYPNARYHIHRREIEYWLADDTLASTPQDRQAFVVGAQSRLPRIQEQLTVFEWGDEILPGIEAVDTHGHTPGHTSFAVHQGNKSVLVVGDALSNVALSFELPKLPSMSDQEPDVAIRTRLRLLDRLAADQMQLIAYHLPTPGFGRVERLGADRYRFQPG
jgi:glyoxylase-like metal-dependent hydrolase (beta-lactamase superfamily II)